MSNDGDLSATLVLRRGGLARVGLERIALIEAIGALGSISAAARQLGLSYKGAWDGVQALNNLFDAPLVVANAGGKAGGAALVTPRGLAVIRAFRDVEREIGAALSRLEAGLSAPDPGLGDLFWSLGLRTSARNALRGTVAAIEDGEVTARVALDLGEGLEIASIITRRSREELGLAVGKPAVALIKSSFVVLGDDDPFEDGTNHLAGTVADREDGGEVSEVTLALSAGKTLVATVAASDATPAVGARATAMIAPSNVILAVE
ncbi:TOBE domain-containing protein [Caulobacter sp. BK020]|uniref:TOBE domain-containing protein n=1 Tax=Caulobacter sp. BK020 TaxID=2512117 RepID=UPI0010461960|nr:TOBE domain-containing protein [Caulobacter sp. BK020]TCS17467.1 molybdate transport system regulatory protein [Caulobacter sp. BK020]